MRIIDKAVTGSDMDALAKRFFVRMNPVLTVPHEFAPGTPARLLVDLAVAYRGRKYGPVLKVMAAKVERLFAGTPAELIDLQTCFVKVHGNEKELFGASFKKILQPVFGQYKTFRTSQARGVIHDWFTALGIAACPYCNREWLTQIGNKAKRDAKFLFDVDHYFPQWRYPYFSLSFYNLIPACAVCNQRLKGSRLLQLNRHLHPYVDDMDQAVKFEVPITSASQFYSKQAPIQVDLRPRAYLDPKYEARAKRMRDFFRLNEIYRTHGDYAGEILQKGRVYNLSTLNELYRSHGSNLFRSKEELVRMVLGNYPFAKDMHKRPLAKLAKDLTEGTDLFAFLKS